MKQETGFELYLRAINKEPLLTSKEEKELSRLARSGNRRARDRMIRANLRLVVSMAKEFVGRGISFQDLVEEGNLGLLKAVEKFDPERNFRFSTYASWWIKQAIQRALLKTAKTIRIPAYIVEMIAKWKKASSELSTKLGRHPYSSEVAKEIKMPEESIEMLKRALNTSYSSHMPISLDVLLTLSSDDIRGVVTKKTKDDPIIDRNIEIILSAITEKEAEILRMRYGLDDGVKMKLLEIGKKMNLSKERVRQIEKESLRKLNEIWMQRKDKLNDLLS